jgi:hypothetical protein
LVRIPGNQPNVFQRFARRKHYFQVRAMDRNGNIDPNPARREFVVSPAWYKETRLVLISSTGAMVALFFAGPCL